MHWPPVAVRQTVGSGGAASCREVKWLDLCSLLTVPLSLAPPAACLPSVPIFPGTCHNPCPAQPPLHLMPCHLSPLHHLPAPLLPLGSSSACPPPLHCHCLPFYCSSGSGWGPVPPWDTEHRAHAVSSPCPAMQPQLWWPQTHRCPELLLLHDRIGASHHMFQALAWSRASAATVMKR